LTESAPAPARPTPARPLPPRPRRLIGRDDALKALAEQLLERRFVTVVGPGGVGKTSVALAVAHDVAASFDGDVCFLDIGNITNPDLLVGGLAAVLGISVQPGMAAPCLTPFLQRRRMLLVLDGCEPVAGAAAAVAAQLIGETAHVHLLATSREALWAEGEHVHRLFPLECPDAEAGQTAQDALDFAAVQMFVDRASSSLSSFTLSDADAPVVGEICRKLDGLALAIELAAGRVAVYGVREVARQLDSQFALVWRGRRTAVARHQTLSATLGWSHDLLSPYERIAFRRLSVFVGTFSLGMATAAVADDEISPVEATELLAGLVSRSLVQFSPRESPRAYRLLDTTRNYAAERLCEAGEGRWMAERHARLIARLANDDGASQSLFDAHGFLGEGSS
jgi:predicted ATPase